MGFLKRLYLLLITLGLITAIALFLLSPQTLSSWSAVVAEQSVIGRVVVAFVFGAVLFALTYFQVRPDRREKATGLMMRSSGAITEVSIDSARERILKVVGAVSDVVNVDAQVKPVRGRADVELVVTVLGDDTELPAKQKEINRALNQVVDKQLGLQMASHPRVKIQLHKEEVPKLAVVPAPTVLPIQEPIKSPPEPKPVTESPVEEKKSILDWLGISPEPDQDKADDDTIHVVSPAVEAKGTDDSAARQPNQSDEMTSQGEIESDTDDTKTPDKEA